MARLTWPARVTLVAGIATIVCMPLMARRQGAPVRFSPLFAISTLVAVVLTIMSVQQVQCSITGGCLLGAWFNTAVIVFAGVAYLAYIRQIAYRDPEMELHTRSIRETTCMVYGNLSERVSRDHTPSQARAGRESGID